MRTKHEIILDMARALTVTTVADAIDNGVIKEGGEAHDPGPGGEWFDTVEGIDSNALKAMKKFANEVEVKTGMTLPYCELLWQQHTSRPSDFGYLLVMQSLGHGVGLSDDFKKSEEAEQALKGMLSDLDDLHIHFSYFDLDPDEWQFTDETNDGD